MKMCVCLCVYVCVCVDVCVGIHVCNTALLYQAGEDSSEEEEGEVDSEVEFPRRPRSAILCSLMRTFR